MKLTLHPAWPSLIILGARVRPGIGTLVAQSQAEQVLVAIVKTTFTADDPSVTPVSAQAPLLMKDDIYPGDAKETIQYEHDLAIDKPKADIVVLGAPEPPQPVGAGVPWTERVTLDGQVMSSTFTDASDIRFTFGWQDRRDGVRLGLAGDCQNFDAESMQLPVGFNNLFFNGGTYAGAGGPVFTHPTPGGLVTIESALAGSTTVRRLHLPSVAPRAEVTYLADPVTRATASAAVSLHIDTIVFDKTTSLFSVTWRGAWPIATVPADRYLGVSLS